MIVILNGPSSAGKSTLAKHAQKCLGTSWMVVAVDVLFAFAHPDHPVNWRLFETLSNATFAAAASAANAGFDVIVDTVFERRDNLESAHLAFSALPHRLVAVTCTLTELERREQERGNRPAGLARRQYSSVFHDAGYALTIDTSEQSLDDATTALARLFDRSGVH